MNLESALAGWGQPPGASEEQRYKNAEKAITNALQASRALGDRDIRVFTHGSYANRTNVRKDSDVDIGVECKDVFFYDLPPGRTAEEYGFGPASSYDYSAFKNEVGEALKKYFGSRAVTRGNKAFNLRENSYHVEADVVPFFEYRRYTEHPWQPPEKGVELLPDKGGVVINWPDRHYANGVAKNQVTRRRFKALVRIVKGLCNHMRDAGVTEAGPIPGFLIECLVWNVSDQLLGGATYADDLGGALAFLAGATKTDQGCSEWGEVSDLKYLFLPGQAWTRAQANEFVLAVRRHTGL